MQLNKMPKVLFLATKIIFFAALVLFFGFVILGFYRIRETAKTDQAIARINARKITLADVMGENLPPKPDQKLNDSTVAGIDANNNGIRDDVELAIFERYPNSARIRAAMLQYSQALQLELTEVSNSETLVKVLQKRSYGGSCIDKTGPKINLKDSPEKIKSDFSVGDNRRKEVEAFVINTNIREKNYLDILDYMTTYSIPTREQCDIDFSSLPN